MSTSIVVGHGGSVHSELHGPQSLSGCIKAYRKSHSDEVSRMRMPELLSEGFMGGVLKSIERESGLVLRGQEQFEKMVSIVNNRLKDIGTDPDGYLRYMSRRRDEVKMLVRNFIVSYTYFFRESDVLSEFESRLSERYDITGRSRIRIWDSGCSVGAETYSIAMIVRDNARVLKGETEMLATDINLSALRVAKDGLYAPEFIEHSCDLRGYIRKFRRSGMIREKEGLYSVHGSLRSGLSFKSHDLLKDDYPSDLDFIFCRNVFIHISDSRLPGIIRKMHRSLGKDGVLFTGKHESFEYYCMFEEAGFTPVHYCDGSSEFYTFAKYS